jgi:predicted ATPase
MASGLLSVDALPEALQALLLRRAEGNPFFLEELLRSCQETGMIRHEGVSAGRGPEARRERSP